MKMRLQHQYKIEKLAHLICIDAKHGKHHVEWYSLYPWIAECDSDTQDNVLDMLDDIAAGLKSTQTLLNKQVQEEKKKNVYTVGEGSQWTVAAHSGG